MIESLTRVLSLISNSLLVPVIVALLALLAWTLLLFGGFLKEVLDRRRIRAGIERGVAAARDGRTSTEVLQALASAGSGLPKRFSELAASHETDGAVIGHVLTRLEHDIADTVARHSFITRVSPMLGLMGTLIPLGPALSGLAAGDLSSLAGNLVVAFTATVVGLLISGLAYGIGLARRTWYSRDLTDLEFVAGRLGHQEMV